MTDLILAIIHHLLVFGLVAMLVAESMLVRPGMRGMDVDRVVRIDVGYGATAGGILIIGLLRVFFGAKGYHFYANNFFFWGKIACFVVILPGIGGSFASTTACTTAGPEWASAALSTSSASAGSSIVKPRAPQAFA